jgi:GntR family transcriptional regulator
MLDDLSLQNNGIPIYVQLRDQIAALVGRGVLKPGMRLPTMREVAVALKVDLNTVQRAYAELEQGGILVLVQGRGTFVADAPPVPESQAVTNKTATKMLAARIAAEARAKGIALGDLADALRKMAQ